MTEPKAKRMRWTYDEPCAIMETSISNEPHLAAISNEPPTSVPLVIALVAPTASAAIDILSIPTFVPTPVQLELTKLADEYEDSFKNASVPGARLPTLRDMKGKRYTLVSIGKEVNFREANIGLKMGTTIANICKEEKGCASCAMCIPDSLISSDPGCLQDLSCSFYTQLYNDNRYRTGEKKKTPAEKMETVYLHMSEASQPFVSHFLKRGKDLSRGQKLAKDIVNAPHNILNSVSLANLARKLSNESQSRNLSCRILDKNECERLGMGAYLAVARGNETEPQFIHMTFKGEEPIEHKVGVVGKGVLFDTGGYNIKTQMSELMKFDCSGAAALLGAAMVMDAMAPKGIEVHFIIAACDNMISSKAFVPGDVLTASNGRTIEVTNTDAEGRLTLADALVYTPIKQSDARKSSS